MNHAPKSDYRIDLFHSPFDHVHECIVCGVDVRKIWNAEGKFVVGYDAVARVDARGWCRTCAEERKGKQR